MAYMDDFFRKWAIVDWTPTKTTDQGDFNKGDQFTFLVEDDVIRADVESANAEAKAILESVEWHALPKPPHLLGKFRAERKPHIAVVEHAKPTGSRRKIEISIQLAGKRPLHKGTYHAEG